MSWGRVARERREAEQRHTELMARLAATGRPDPKPLIPEWLQAAWSGTRRAAWRHRRILAPFVVLAVVAAVGGAVAARQTPPAVVAVLAAIAGTGWWRARAGRLDRHVERRYAAACLAAPAVWLTWTAGAGPLWLALTAGWTVLAAPWWRHHWPRPRIDAPDVDPVADPIVALWDAHVGCEQGPLPGARLVDPQPFEHGREYRVELVPGRHTVSRALSLLEPIGSGMRTPQQRFVLEAHPDFADTDPTICRYRMMPESPVKDTVLYDRPRTDAGTILLGPHVDGAGDASWRLYTRNSMWGGFVLGSTGLGKSRLIEGLALGARALSAAGQPTMVVYIDGQEGASSSTLWAHAALRAGPTGATEILDALERVVLIRQRFNVVHRLDGFTPGAAPDGAVPGLVGILVIIDECHVLFAKSAGNARRWARIAREGRKVGVVLAAASQYNDLNVFGSEDPLRSSLLAGNGLVMHTASTQASDMIPGLHVRPSNLPAIPGYGYKVAAKGSGERTAPFRGRYLPNWQDKHDDPGIGVPTVEEWFERTADAPLDDMSARAMGDIYLRRDELAREAREEIVAELEGRAPVPVVMSKPAAKDSTLDVIERMLLAGPQKRGDILRHVCAATGVSESAVRSALGAGKVRGRLEALTTAPDGSSGHGWYGLTRAKETVG